MIRRRPAILLLLLAAPAAVPGETLENFHFSRPVPVERPGWIRVRLDARAQSRGGPGDTWRIFDPDGEPVAARVLRPPAGTLSVRVRQVEKTTDGWRLLIDLGPAPVRHRSIRIDAVRPVTVPGCLLEGSGDLQDWHLLARGDLFRVGEGEGLRGSILEYPATQDRFLRLHWPESGGFPEIRRVEVEIHEAPAGGTVLFPFRVEPVEESEQSRRFLLEAPGGGLAVKRIDLGFGGAGPQALRLFAADRGRWIQVAEREFRRGERGKTVTVHPGEAPMPSYLLRLAIYPGGGTENRLHAATGAIDPVWVAFRAERPGTHRLAYGRWESPDRSPDGEPAGAIGDPLVEAPLGPEIFTPSPPIAPRLTAPMFPHQEPVMGASWTVNAAGAKPGSWVRLPIPSEVYDRTGEESSSWRLIAGGRLIPFLERTLPEPEAVLEERDATTGGRGTADGWEWEIPLSPSAANLTQLEIRTGDVPLRADLWVEFHRQSRPGLEARPVYGSGRRTWECGESRVLPCRIAFDLSPRPGAGYLKVRMGRREGRAAPRLHLIGWRERRERLFVWPEEGPVRLQTGFEPEPDPFPLLDDFRSRIVEMPWSAARLDLEEAAVRREAGERLTGRFLLLVLIVVGGVLVILFLRAVLGKKPG